MVEYRALRSEEDAAFDRIRQYAFHPDDGPAPDDDRETDLGTRYGLFESGDLASICLQYVFDARLRGTWIDLGGLGAVATTPEHRRQGYARLSLRESVSSFAEQEVPFVALWPFKTSFYSHLGWTTANKLTEYSCAPDVLTDLGTGEGEFRPVEPAAWRTLREIHLAAGEGETLSRTRSEDWWRQRVFAEWGEKRRYVYRYDRDSTPAGYVAYSIQDGELSVAELGANDTEAFLDLLGFLGNHGTMIDQVSFQRPAESTLLDLVERPEAVECSVEPGPMVRATDVELALETTPYPEDVTETITVEVTDPLWASNEGTYRLAVADGKGVVTENEGGDPDVTTDIGTLSGLIVGAEDPETAGHRGDLVTDSASGERIDRLFPRERVFLREFF